VSTETTPEKTTTLYRAPPWVTNPVDAASAAIERMGPGDRASLRRLRPEQLHEPAFWKLTTTTLNAHLPTTPAARDAAEQRWAMILPVLADAIHVPGRRLGTALAEAGVSEGRLIRLLRAQGEALEGVVRAVAHQLASAGAPFDHADLAWLVLTEGRDDAEKARHQVARDYYYAVGKDQSPTT
jgi:CRISPR system Cascade subunit CasB